jgi:hypothetical protein
MSRVSKRWHGLVFQTSAFWRSVTLDGDYFSRRQSDQQKASWIRNKRALLRHATAFVTDLTVKRRYAVEKEVRACLGSWPLASMLGDVRQQLTSLNLHWCELPRDVISILGSMPRLLSLACTTDRLPAQAVSTIAQLTQLTSLKLKFELARPSSALHLTALQQLHHLQIWRGA